VKKSVDIVDELCISTILTFDYLFNFPKDAGNVAIVEPILGNG
jgi:hypothetical protein